MVFWNCVQKSVFKIQCEVGIVYKYISVYKWLEYSGFSVYNEWYEPKNIVFSSKFASQKS